MTFFNIFFYPLFVSQDFRGIPIKTFKYTDGICFSLDLYLAGEAQVERFRMQKPSQTIFAQQNGSAKVFGKPFHARGGIDESEILIRRHALGQARIGADVGEKDRYILCFLIPQLYAGDRVPADGWIRSVMGSSSKMRDVHPPGSSLLPPICRYSDGQGEEKGRA